MLTFKVTATWKMTSTREIEANNLSEAYDKMQDILGNENICGDYLDDSIEYKGMQEYKRFD